MSTVSDHVPLLGIWKDRENAMRSSLMAALVVAGVAFTAAPSANAAPINGVGAMVDAIEHGSAVVPVQHWRWGSRGGHWRWGSRGGHWRWGSRR